jgi:hypothetical protein
MYSNLYLGYLNKNYIYIPPLTYPKFVKKFTFMLFSGIMERGLTHKPPRVQLRMCFMFFTWIDARLTKFHHLQ